MIEDFADSAARHWADAELLLQEGRKENADQLYGISTECALKTVLVHPPQHAAAGELPKAYRMHVNELWDRITVGAIPRHMAALIPLLRQENPFKDWDVSQRYWKAGTVADLDMKRHRQSAKRILAAAHVVGHRES